MATPVEVVNGENCPEPASAGSARIVVARAIEAYVDGAVREGTRPSPLVPTERRLRCLQEARAGALLACSRPGSSPDVDALAASPLAWFFRTMPSPRAAPAPLSPLSPLLH